MENNLQKSMEHDMETGVMGLIVGVLGAYGLVAC